MTDLQVRKLMEEMSKHGRVGLAAMRAGMDRKTARKYVREGVLPSQMKTPRSWRTRADPFAEDWERIAAMLEAAPELEAKALFEWWIQREPGHYQPGQLRTFQRRVRQWRALQGPDKEVFFAQCHLPGQAAQTDFTSANQLQILIGGEPFPHMLCHFVLPFSNWQWATICRSESMAALSTGVQEAVFRLGRTPCYHQTDNSTAATHDLRTGKRGFNEDYAGLMRHLGMQPRTTKIGAKEQNGDVEAANGALKRRLEQHLLLRGSRDFEAVGAYADWLTTVLVAANDMRTDKVTQELRNMKELVVERLAAWRDFQIRVSAWSTIRVMHNAYSVPSRLIGERVDVRVHEDRLEVRLCGVLQLTVDRLLGRHKHRINYRHVIWSLVRKPGAFRRYRYQKDLFPTLVFRRAYDDLCEHHDDFQADLEYVRILHLAASTMESEVEAVLVQLLQSTERLSADLVKSHIVPAPSEHPQLSAYQPELGEYDHLLRGVS